MKAVTTKVDSIIGSRLLRNFPQAQSISFSARSIGTKANKPGFNILFFCPRNDDHFRSFDNEHPEFIKSTNPDSISVTDIAHNPQNNNRAIVSLLNNDVSPSIIIPHMVLIGHSKEEADQKIKFFRDNGIKSIMAIRGNPLTIGKGKECKSHPEGYEDMPHLMRRIKEIPKSSLMHWYYVDIWAK
jgi:methylenetetrahydrofolate reductase (NADPH)